MAKMKMTTTELGETEKGQISFGIVEQLAHLVFRRKWQKSFCYSTIHLPIEEEEEEEEGKKGEVQLKMHQADSKKERKKERKKDRKEERSTGLLLVSGIAKGETDLT